MKLLPAVLDHVDLQHHHQGLHLIKALQDDPPAPQLKLEYHKQMKESQAEIKKAEDDAESLKKELEDLDKMLETLGVHGFTRE